jgi:hypothetical protein
MAQEFWDFSAQVDDELAARFPNCTATLSRPIWVLGNRAVAMEPSVGNLVTLSLYENGRLIRRRANAAVLGAPVGTARFIRLLLQRGR